MVTFILDLHGETTPLEDAAFLFYPLRREGHLHVVTPSRPVRSTADLEPALDEMRSAVRLRLLRQETRRTPAWQIVALLRPSLPGSTTLDGALTGQLACLEYTLLTPLKAEGLHPDYQWAVVLDDLIRDRHDPEETEKRGRPLRDSEAERRWYLDTRGYAPTSTDEAPFFAAADVGRLDQALVRSRREQAATAATDGARRWWADQLQALDGTHPLGADAVRRRLSLAAFADKTAILRLEIPPDAEGASRAWLHLAYALLILASKEHLRQEVFDKTRAAILVAPRQLYVELDTQALAEALHRYRNHLQQTKNDIANRDYRSAITMLAAYTDTCTCTERIADLAFEPPPLYRALFFDRADLKHWIDWLYQADDGTVARIIQRTFPGYDGAASGRAGPRNGQIARIVREREEEVPRKARACFEQAYRGPGARPPEQRAFEEVRDGTRHTWTFDEEVQRREEAHDKARDALAAVQLNDPWTPGREERLRAAERRVRRLLPERPTPRRMAVTAALGLLALLLPHAFLLRAGATTWDYALLAPVLLVLTGAVAYRMAVGLRRDLQARIDHVIVQLKGWHDAVAAFFDTFKAFIQALCSVRVTRKNLDLAHEQEEQVKQRNRQNDLHEQRYIQLHVERADKILSLLSGSAAVSVTGDREYRPDLDVERPVEDNPCYWLSSYGTGTPPVLKIGMQNVKEGEQPATRDQLLPGIPYPPGLHLFSLELDEVYYGFISTRDEAGPGPSS